MVIMNPYEAEALLRFTSNVSLNQLSSKADTLIEMATSLNFVSKEFVMADSFYKVCKIALKLSLIRVTSERRISTTKGFSPTVFTINGKK